jgi:hypothetical protein
LVHSNFAVPTDIAVDEPTAVPEPSALGVAGLGFGALTILRRRRSLAIDGTPFSPTRARWFYDSIRLSSAV